MQPADLHRQCLRLQAVAVAGAAGPVVLVALKLLAHPGAVGFLVAAFHIGDHPLERPCDVVNPPALIIAERDFLAF